MKKCADDTKVYRKVCTKDDAADFQKDLDNMVQLIGVCFSMWKSVRLCMLVSGYGNA